MHAASVLTALGVTAAAVALTTTVASAAPVQRATSSSLANTTQKIAFHERHNGTYGGKEKIVYATSTFTVPAYQDSGSFTNTGGNLTMKITSGADKGCKFTATYDAPSTYYYGTYTCTNGITNNFRVTTSGS